MLAPIGKENRMITWKHINNIIDDMNDRFASINKRIDKIQKLAKYPPFIIDPEGYVKSANKPEPPELDALAEAVRDCIQHHESDYDGLIKSGKMTANEWHFIGYDKWETLKQALARYDKAKGE